MGKIRGSLTISSNIIYFDPHPVTDPAVLDLIKQEGLTVSNFQCCLDFNDIVSIQKLRGANKSSQYVDDLAIKKHYLYDYYIQINLSRVNGHYLEKLAEPHAEGGELALSQASDFEASQVERSAAVRRMLATFKKEKEPAIASVFFRFSHRSGDNEVLNN